MESAFRQAKRGEGRFDPGCQFYFETMTSPEAHPFDEIFR
jgi:hypothetical protein